MEFSTIVNIFTAVEMFEIVLNILFVVEMFETILSIASQINEMQIKQLFRIRDKRSGQQQDYMFY